eukprot:5789154-Pleurochrysis_carterae.AAC.1
MPGNRRWGASGTPGFSCRIAVATVSSVIHSRCARPPAASCATSCVPALHPRAAPVAWRETAYPP